MSGARVEQVEKIDVEHLDEGQLNIVVFGPGRGEGIVVVLPDGSVGAIDGCAWPTNPTTGEGDPVHEFVRSWMRKQRVPRPDQKLAFACITHLHDDHYLGFSTLLRRYPPRHLWRTSALTDRDLEVAEKASLADASFKGRREQLRQTLETLDSFLRQHASRTTEATLEAEGQSVTIGDDESVELIPAGPPRWAVRNVLSAVSARKPLPDPNQASGALCVRWREATVLFGGDLLAHSYHDRIDVGWRPFLDRLRAREITRVQLVSVAHHGSANAHDSDLWTAMSPELAVITPFMHAAGSQPPRPSDIERFLNLGARTIVTSPPRWLGHEPGIRALRTLPAASASESKEPPLPGSASLDGSDLRSAVLVSLGGDGIIRRVVAAGQASEYSLASG